MADHFWDKTVYFVTQKQGSGFLGNRERETIYVCGWGGGILKNTISNLYFICFLVYHGSLILVLGWKCALFIVTELVKQLFGFILLYYHVCKIKWVIVSVCLSETFFSYCGQVKKESHLPTGSPGLSCANRHLLQAAVVLKESTQMLREINEFTYMKKTLFENNIFKCFKQICTANKIAYTCFCFTWKTARIFLEHNI